jgi:hypothetical protein
LPDATVFQRFAGAFCNAVQAGDLDAAIAAQNGSTGWYETGQAVTGIVCRHSLGTRGNTLVPAMSGSFRVTNKTNQQLRLQLRPLSPRKLVVVDVSWEVQVLSSSQRFCILAPSTRGRAAQREHAACGVNDRGSLTGVCGTNGVAGSNPWSLSVPSPPAQQAVARYDAGNYRGRRRQHGGHPVEWRSPA